MIEIQQPRLSPPPSHPPEKPAKDERLMQQAREFEAVFIAQMLKHSGLAKAISSDSGFGGDAFSSMLLEQYAEKMTEKGGFGLAEHIYNQLADREALNETDTAA